MMKIILYIRKTINGKASVLAAAFLLSASPSFAIIDPISFGTALGYTAAVWLGAAGVGTYQYFTKPAATNPSTVRADGTLVTPGAVVYVDLVNGVPTAVEKAVNIETNFSDFSALAAAPGVDQSVTNAFMQPSTPLQSYGQNGDFSGVTAPVGGPGTAIGKYAFFGGYTYALTTYIRKDVYCCGVPSPLPVPFSTMASGNVYYHYYPDSTGVSLYQGERFFGNYASPVTGGQAGSASTPAQVKTNFETNAGAMTAIQAMFAKSVAENKTVPHPITDPVTGVPVLLPSTILNPQDQTIITTGITGQNDVDAKKKLYDDAVIRLGNGTGTQADVDKTKNAWIAAGILRDKNNEAVKPPTSTTPVIGPVTVPGTGTAYSAGASSGDFSGRFSSFMTTMKGSGLFALPGQVLGNIPGGGSPVFNLSFGRMGSTTFDLSMYSTAIALIRILVLFVFSITGFKIITLKGGSS